MSPGLLTLFAFVAAALAVIGIYSILSDLFLRDRVRVSRRVDEEFRRRQRDQIQKSALFKADFARLAAEAAAENEERPTLRQRFVTMIEQSALNITPERLLLIVTAAGIGCAAVAALIRPNLLLAIGAAAAGAGIPVLYVRIKQQARLKKMMQQLPDAFDLMARIIRAGQTMSQALQSVADEFDQPIAGEFAYCYEQQNLGLSPEISLRDLARRTGLLEIKIFVLALLVQQQSGGNLAEMLDKLSHVIRERFRLRAKIRAVTAEGRAQAVLLLALPIVLLFAFTALSEVYAGAISKHPNIIGFALIAEVIGALWIRKIVNFDF
jgi:tight adherence protein B